MINQSLQKTIDIEYDKIPAILIGNGINRITNNNLSWNGMLDNLIKVSGTAQIRKENRPLTFLFEETRHRTKGAQLYLNVQFQNS